MPGLILQAQEMEELFWLGMGYDSDDGERDESFAPSQESAAAGEEEDGSVRWSIGDGAGVKKRGKKGAESD